jgi:glycerophosphoryl diester phosphodiesterase
LWDYAANQPTDTFFKARALGLVLHIWTFKDDVLFFNATSNIVRVFFMQDMYSIGHKTLKLDGVITEFADIYAPLAQLWKAIAEE